MAMKMGPRERVSSVVRTGAILLLGGLGTVLDVLFVSCIPPWMCVPLPAVPIVLPLFPFFAGVFLIIAGLWRETEDAERRERTARERRSALTVSVTLLIALTLVVAWGLGAFGPPFGSQPGPFCGVIGPATNKPFGTFYLPNATTSAVEIAVASMSPAQDSDCFFVNLELNGTPGVAARLLAIPNGTVSISLGNYTSSAAGAFAVRWMDPDGDGKLAAGDSFAITHPNGLPSPGSYVFYLMWTDESTIQSVTFRTT